MEREGKSQSAHRIFQCQLFCSHKGMSDGASWIKLGSSLPSCIHSSVSEISGGIWQLGFPAVSLQCHKDERGLWGERCSKRGKAMERGQALLRGWEGLDQPAGSSATQVCNLRCSAGAVLWHWWKFSARIKLILKYELYYLLLNLQLLWHP